MEERADNRYRKNAGQLLWTESLYLSENFYIEALISKAMVFGAVAFGR